MSQAIAIVHRDTILARLAEGQRLSDIAPELGLASPNSISKVLKDDPEYAAAIESGHAVKLDRAERMIEDAQDQVDVSRARALHSAYAWRAGVEASHRWGAKPNQINIQTNIGTMDTALGLAFGELLEAARRTDERSIQPDVAVLQPHNLENDSQ